MDHSFNDRVDKVFGSISSSSSWSLTDAQVERRVWSRDKAGNRDDDDTLVSSSYDKLFNGRRNHRKSAADDLSEDDGDVGGDDGVETENDGDEWDIRSSIGLDSTLDNEEEEDAYDKMAEGRENGGDRVYMKDVTDHGPYLNSHNVLKKDPRANHDAAKARLEEDDEPMLNAEETACVTMSATGIKSILKRKNDDDEVKPGKRVRFDPTCKNDDEESRVFGPRGPGNGPGPGVPDYVQNPSKYTRYDLDFDKEGSNREAYQEKSKDVGVEEKSVVFIPRKKRGDGEEALVNNKQSSSTKAGSGITSIAVEDLDEDEVQGQEMPNVSTKKPDRRYRSRMDKQDDTAS